MVRISRASVAGLVLLLAGCAGSDSLKPTGPNGGPNAGPSAAAPAAVFNPYCAPVTAAGISSQIDSLFIKNSWPDESSAQGKFANVQSLLAANDTAGARSATNNLVSFIANKFNHLTSSQQVASQTLYNQLISALWCYVGISGQVFDLNPGDTAKTFDVPGVGGVLFPANSVPVGTFVSLTDLSNQPNPLVTPLDTYASYLAIDLYPPAVLPQAATVVLCSQPPAPPTVLVGHQDPTVGFEILTPTTVPPTLQGTCGTTSGLKTPRSLFERLLAQATRVFLPQPLEASSSMMFLGGIGGLTTKFSPFGLVDPTLSATDGIGSKTTSFAPPAAAPNAAPANNPPLPPSYFQGSVGTTATSGLASVTILTPGFDANGANPVANVTVTFRTAPSVSYSPASQAKVCRIVTTTDGNGNPVNTVVLKDTVQVKTDANGLATLPCLSFGTVAGFANLSATFDPATLNFPNANLVTINASDGSSSGGSLNWLVKSNAGQPAQLSALVAPSSSAAAGVAFAQQPQFQLLDGLGNEVYLGGVQVTAAVTSGGGTATSSPVTTDANGVATFTDLTIGGKVAGVTQTLAFSFTGIASPYTASVMMTPGPASQLAITTQPSTTAQAGVAFAVQPVATIEDQFGNTVSSSAAVAASLASGAPSLAGTTSVAAVGGVATFSNLRIDGATGDRTLKFASGSLTSAASTTISVGAGPATKLAITTQPSSTASAGVAFAVQPVVTVQDQFGNTVNSGASVTATIASGAPAVAGTVTIAAVGGIASYSDLRIDGVTGVRTLQFGSGTLTPAVSNAVTVSAGLAAAIKTYFPPAAPAQSYGYGSALTAYTNVSPAPQVLVTDAFGNPVGSQPVFWNATTSNGGVLTVGSGGTTTASGVAQVTSWNIGEGFNQAIASIFDPNTTPPAGYLPANFTATTPTGVSIFACSLGGSKTDLAPFSIKTPNGTVRTVTLYMSVTGASSSVSAYPATIKVFKDGLTGTQLGSGGGTLELPGDNGNPVAMTFVLADPVTKTESQGSSTLWFQMSATVPATRKVQLWYQNGTFKSNDPCASSKVYTPSYPSVTTSKAGLSINVTN